MFGIGCIRRELFGGLKNASISSPDYQWNSVRSDNASAPEVTFAPWLNQHK